MLTAHVRTIAGRKIVFDKDGFLMDFEDWSEEVFECLAKESGLSSIDDRHWRVIRFLRSFYAYNGRAPLHRQLKEGTGMSVLEMEELISRRNQKRGQADGRTSQPQVMLNPGWGKRQPRTQGVENPEWLMTI